MFDDVRRGSARFGEVRRGSAMFGEVRRYYPMFSDVLRCSTMFNDVRRCSTMFGDVRRCSAILSDVQRYYPMFSDIIRASIHDRDSAYPQAVGAILYASTVTRPDLSGCWCSISLDQQMERITLESSQTLTSVLPLRQNLVTELRLCRCRRGG